MIYVIILLSVLTRFLPHTWNFSPVYGALLFGGAHLKKRESVWFPVALLALSDFLLTTFVYRLHIGWLELVQVAAFASIALIGWVLRRGLTAGRFSFACFAGPTAFYLISNFGVWLEWHTYAPTWAGLMQCYVAGIPFYGYSLLSTYIFSGVLFGTYELCHRYRQSRRGEAHLNY